MLNEDDEIKLKQKTSQVMRYNALACLFVTRNAYVIDN